MGIVLGGRRVVFEPEAQAFDEVSPDSKSELARKVRTLAGNYQLAWLMPELLSPVRNRLWWQFVSHKLARLAAPWALLVVLLGTSALTLTADLSPSWKALYRSAAVGQIGFYLLAAVGAVAPTRAGGAFRVFRLPYAFALLNWASALALFAFLAGSARVDWKTTGAPRSDTDTPIENESTGGI
jgi:hypothetical protein